MAVDHVFLTRLACPRRRLHGDRRRRGDSSRRRVPGTSETVPETKREKDREAVGADEETGHAAFVSYKSCSRRKLCLAMLQVVAHCHAESTTLQLSYVESHTVNKPLPTNIDLI